MPLLVFGGNSSPSSSLEPCNVTISKPSGTKFYLSVFYTTARNGDLRAEYNRMTAFVTSNEYEVAKGSAIVVVNEESTVLDFDTVGDVELARAQDDEVQIWLFEATGDGEIIFTE